MRAGQPGGGGLRVLRSRDGGGTGALCDAGFHRMV